MDKEEIKKILIDLIDSADIVQDFNISNDTLEITDISSKWKEIQQTGFTNIYITTYKRRD